MRGFDRADYAAQYRREAAASFDQTSPLPGVDPLYVLETSEFYDGHEISLNYLRAGGPRAPRPAGLARLPGPGEQVVSPALARLLASPAGAPMRARYPARTIGTIGPAGLPGGPGDLTVWVGSADLRGQAVYQFGWSAQTDPLPPLLWALLVVGLVTLLFPMFVLMSAVSRLSAADRRRRLAAIRLIGAGAHQVRRIAAGEVLAGALLGLLVGAVLFLALRPLVGNDALQGVSSFAGVRPFTADIVPAWPLVVLIALLVPGSAVLTAVFALRRTLVEPLEVVQWATPKRLRLSWRLAPGVGGVALLLAAGHTGTGPAGQARTSVLVGGTVLLLLSVPLLLPWLVQRLVRRPRDETAALQMATRRLQLEGGPPARLAAGVGVTLAGAIGLSALLGAAQDTYARDLAPPPLDRAIIHLFQPVDDDPVAGTLRAVPGVIRADRVQQLSLATQDGVLYFALVAPCPVLRTLAPLQSCVDGGMYGSPGFDPGRSARVMLPDGRPSRYALRLPVGLWPVDGVDPQLLATPGSVQSVPADRFQPTLSLRLDSGDPGAVDRVRAALAPAGWHAELDSKADLFGPTQNTRNLVAIRRALLSGVELMLTVAAVALLVLCLQQVREARRLFAALAAVGVPRAVLGRSMLWHNAILAVTALFLADVAGVGLGVLLLQISLAAVRIDWPTVGTLTAAAAGTVTVTTLLGIPALRGATRPTALRTE